MVDFTKTKDGKKLAPPKEIAPSVGGFLDFTSVAPQSSSTETTTPASSTPSTFGFLSDFSASAAPSTPTYSSTPSYSTDNADVNALRIKIEDMEFKMERLLERLAEMESKFGRI